MARLNDPPVPAAEGIDALKRRFIRQNREIARVNSNQSQRIRNLESEISRLLSENIALREQAINSAAEAERWRTLSTLGRDVISLKARLESKLCEVSLLVHELGGLPDKAGRRTSIERRKSGFTSQSNRSPDGRDWRTKRSVGDVLNPEQDGRLPPILEDKYYPRRTLDATELCHLAQDHHEKQDTESPDLGPPPVVHFDVSVPIAFTGGESPKSGSEDPLPSSDTIQMTRNLETRRKRRTSSLLQNMANLEDEETAAAAASDEMPQLVKSGPRRKVEANEFEQQAEQLNTDEFMFQRKSSMITSRSRGTRFVRAPGAARREPVEQQSSEKPASQVRQALGPKSTNSPAKKSLAPATEKEYDLPELKGIEKPRTHRTSARQKEQPLFHIEIPLHSENDGLDSTHAPKTPAAELMEPLSPSSVPTEPSSKVKSQEAAITNSVEDVLNGSIGRGSRRARAAVSYAEPSLRDKMRRPDKKMVGAVEGLARRDSSRGQSMDLGDSHGTESRVNSVKRESTSDNRDAQWTDLPRPEDCASVKHEPTSPSQDREKKPALVVNVQRRHKRSHSEFVGRDAQIQKSAIEDDLQRAVEKLSIFNLPDSSPIADSKQSSSDSSSMVSQRSTSAPTSILKSASSSSTSRVGRRHSMQPQASNLAKNTTTTTKATVSSANAAHVPRPSSAASVRSKEPLETSAVIGGLKRATSVQGLSRVPPSRPADIGGGGGGTADSASVRSTIGTRRRSMMV